MPISINQQIKENATRWKEWRHHDKATEAYELFDKVNTALFDSQAPQPVIGFDDTVKEEGFYHWEGDNVSLSFHVDIPQTLTRLQLVIAAIHNVVHVTNETLYTKTTWYHKKAFQDSMAELGVNVGKDGSTLSLNLDVFMDTLRKLGEGELAEKLLSESKQIAAVDTLMNQPETSIISEMAEEIAEAVNAEIEADHQQVLIETPIGVLPAILEPDLESESDSEHIHTPAQIVQVPVNPKPPSTSKMKKWACLCTIVRCATELDAGCHKCHSDFSLQP